MFYFYIIIGAIFVGNCYLLVSRRSKSIKTTKNVREERQQAQTKLAALERRLIQEQEEAARRVDLQNRTLELYEQCRKDAELRESGEGET